MYRALLVATLMLLLSGIHSAFSQQIVNHINQTFQNEDGNATYDEDGTVNGTVIWRTGVVHVVYRYEVYGRTQFPNPVFIIRPGAIVKFAFSFSTNGGITWTAATDGWMAARGFNFPVENVTIQIDGAAITDIRDDAVGGDTNGDGNASTPSFWGDLIFSGSPRDAVRNSTIKYSLNISHIGSMELSGNTFAMFGGFRYFTGLGSSVLNASPRFTGNTFQRGIQGVGLDLRGLTPIIENNTFRDTLTGYAILVGPAAAQSGGQIVNIGPTSGTIVISNNRIETKEGLSLSEFSRQESLYTKGSTIRAEIRGNTLRGPRNVGAGLELAFAAEASVTDNTISNYGSPIRFYFDNQTLAGNRTQCGLHVNNNRFSLEGVSSSYGLFWLPPPTSPAAQSNVLIDMKNNDWGDPSGPLDTTISDGRSNPRGRGLRINSNTIDYVPFIGAAGPPQRDFVRLIVSSPSTSTPLVPGSSVALNSSIDLYDLVSAPTGQIVVLLRDADGIILNQPGTIVNVTSGNHTANIPPIQFTVPTLSNTVVVEANLAPAGNIAAVRSNVIAFAVNLPPSSLRISTTGPTFVRGNIESERVDMMYTLTSANPGTIELDFREREVGTGTVLTTFPLLTLPAPSGTNRTLTHTATLDIPLRNVNVHPRIKGEVVLVVSLKNDVGAVVGQQQQVLPINENANRIKLTTVIPFVSSTPPLIPRQHFTTGTVNVCGLQFDYTISTRSITDWQVWIGFDKLFDASGTIIHQYTASSPQVTNASTGTSTRNTGVVSGQTPIPAQARKYRAIIRLVSPALIVVAMDSIDFPVLSSVATTSRVVAAGASVVAFTPVTATLNFTANQTAGLAVAEEFNGQFGGASAMTNPPEPFYWRFIPLLRYWSVYDTLRDGTFTANLTFTYSPADIPSDPNFREDSLVVCGYNPLSRQLEALPSTLNRTNRTVMTAYTKFFDTWVVASKSTILLSSPAVVALPRTFSLEQNYPNPFNPTTTIQYDLPSVNHVILKVFDILGREVRTLVNEIQDAGFKSVQFDASRIAGGVYFYRLTSGHFSATRKLLLIK